MKSLGPIVFDATHPIVIRPKAPEGFTLETSEGQLIARCDVPFEHAQFQLTSAPNDCVAVTVDIAWTEWPGRPQEP